MDPFEVLKIGERGVVVRDGNGGTHTVEMHQAIGPWSLMALLEKNGEPIAVFENHGDENGPILYVAPRRTVAALPKSLEPTRVPEATCYLGRTLKDVLDRDEDLLGDEILAAAEDPCYEKVASCLPPLRKTGSTWGGGIRSLVSFVGSRDCVDKPAIMEDLCTSCFQPGAAIPQLRGLIASYVEQPKAGHVCEGLVGGWLPVLRYRMENWEFIIFADPRPDTQWIQPVWYRIVRRTAGRLEAIHYFDSFVPHPPRGEPDPKAFYTRLLTLHEDWQAVMEPSMAIDVPDRRIADFCRHGLVREMITRIGDWPKYGVYDRNYNGPEHDGFQDTFNTAVNAMLEWRLFDVAGRYVENYLSNFLRDDGSVNYRGPELGQYGRHLTVLAQYYSYTRDETTLLTFHRRIRAIADLLVALREEAVKLPAEDPAYGMIVGWCEADSCLVSNADDHTAPHFALSAEAARGFHDIGEVWIEIGHRLSRQDLVREGRDLLTHAEQWIRDLHVSIERSIVNESVPPLLPSIAGSKVPACGMPPEGDVYSINGSGNWRGYSEMLHSGCLTRRMVQTIIRYQAKHGGRLLGIPTSGQTGKMMGFTVYGYAHGLLQHGLIREFLLFYYSHMAHLHTRGTWTASEGSATDRSDRSQPYCSPAQLTIPTLTKWMLVFEEPFSPTVWLARGAPRPWLEDGKAIFVKAAPTKWGTVSYRIVSCLARERIDVELDLPAEGFQAKIKLCLRLPAGQAIRAVAVNGTDWRDFDPKEETIVLPSGSRGRHTIAVGCHSRS